MTAMGIDIGTTTISVALLDEDSGALIARETVPHNAFIDDGCPVGKVQNPEQLWALVRDCVDALTRANGRPACIGLTGQMHGMLYVDRAGRAVSPLYTWQDGRGSLPLEDGRTAVQILRETGCAAASGYGLTTHYVLHRQGAVPADAAGMTTISDYVAMKLTGATRPVLSADMAASWGGYDLKGRAFSLDALHALGINTELLPRTRPGYDVVGEMPGGTPVTCALGDNQASVLGSVQSLEDTLLINVGTGSQVSIGAGRFIPCEGSVELRPCTAKGYILVGSGLCGGRAYALLERFYRETAGTDAPRYDAMLAQALDFIERFGPDAAWKVRTTFSGTRDDPDERGAISGIGIDNFHPGALTVGVVAGMLEELRAHYGQMCALTGSAARQLVGSGNGLRKNPLMRSLAEGLFGLKLRVPAHQEEAAFGAALCAMVSAGRVKSLAEAQRLIRYL